MGLPEYIRNYRHKASTATLEVLNLPHSHRVTRSEYETLRDEFALEELLSVYPLAEEQWLTGWARSYYSHDEHMNSILTYGSPDLSLKVFDRLAWNYAIDRTREELSKLGLVRALDVLTELDQVPFESTSAAGYDYTGSKGSWRGENHKRAMRRARATVGAIIDEVDGLQNAIETMTPDVGYTRTQLTYLPDKLKVRGVWGRAFHYILIEGTTASPILDAFKGGNTFFYIGHDPILNVPEAIAEAKRQGEWIFTLDWTAFDSSASTIEINTAFNLIKECLRFPNFETEAAFELSRQIFLHKKIAAPDGNIYWSHKGVPSGSYYTMIIGSIINKLRCEYIWFKLYQESPSYLRTQSDDALGSSKQQLDVDAASRIAAKLGWTLNPAKTEVSRSSEFIEFLGRTSRGGINMRELVRCIRLLIYPERVVPSGQISAYRARAIAQDAGGLSDILNKVADRLELKYGFIDESEIPKEFKIFIA